MKKARPPVANPLAESAGPMRRRKIQDAENELSYARGDGRNSYDEAEEDLF